MNTTAKELALGGMFTALGVVLLCLGGVVPLALYACPILASAVLLPVREAGRVELLRGHRHSGYAARPGQGGVHAVRLSWLLSARQAEA